MPDLDPLLHRALATYIAEPGPRLERRVLARIRRSHWLRWAAVGAVAATLLIMAMRPTAPHTALPLPHGWGSVKSAAVPIKQNPGREGGREGREVPRRPTLTAKQRPIAPTGVPLSPQEQRWAQIVQTHPELFANAPVPGETIQPLTTEPINIKPLTPLTN